MPKLIREGERDTGRPGPVKACTRCSKLWYDYAIWIGTVEGRRYNSELPYYEGQTPPKGYKTWEDYRVRCYAERIAFAKKKWRFWG